jgi:uncharacterized protein YecA (UPF0149 family)
LEEVLQERFRYSAQTPYRRESPKVGRNDFCPCGSGKEFKRCCTGQPLAAAG